MVEIGWTDWKTLGVTVVAFSLLLSGIVLGLGRAFNNRKLELFGIEELLQSIINAAILGAVAMLEASISTIGGGFFVEKKCGDGVVAIEWISCIITNLSDSVFSFLQEIITVLTTIGYYEQLTIDFNVFSIKPLVNLSGISSMLSTQANLAQLLLILLNLHLQILNFINSSAFPILFAAGLIFRVFFATRKFGGFLIAFALGFFLLYPITILTFPDPKTNVDDAVLKMANFTNNSAYAPWPIVDLNDNYAIAAKIDNISGWGVNTSANLGSDLTVITRANADALSAVLMYSVVAPLFALVVALVFIKELADILGSEITVPFKVI